MVDKFQETLFFYVYLDAFIVFKILTMITPVDQVTRIFKWPNFFQTQCIYNVSHTFLGPTKPCFYTLDATFSSFSTLADIHCVSKKFTPRTFMITV